MKRFDRLIDTIFDLWIVGLLGALAIGSIVQLVRLIAAI